MSAQEIAAEFAAEIAEYLELIQQYPGTSDAYYALLTIAGIANRKADALDILLAPLENA